MGRTDQVLTGGFFSYNHLTTMKAVLALLLVCLVQISFAEQEDIAADGAPSDTNLLLQREVREAAKGNKGRGCDKEDKKCKNKQRQRKKKTRKRLRKQQKDKKGKKSGRKNKTSRKRLRKQRKKDMKDQKSGRKNKTSKEGNNGAKKEGKKGRKKSTLR